MRLSSYDQANGLAFDEDTQSFVRLSADGVDGSADYGVAHGGDEDDNDGGEYTGDDDVRSLKGENAKLRRQVKALQDLIDQMRAKQEQETRDAERATSLAEAGMRTLGELKAEVSDQAERALMREANALAQSRHGMSYKSLATSDYNAAVRVLSEAERNTK